MFDRYNFVKRSLPGVIAIFVHWISTKCLILIIEEIGELSTEENPDTIRGRPLMTFDFRVKIFRHSR